MLLSQTPSPLPRRLPNKALNLQGVYGPRIRYIDTRLTPKVKDISSNKGSPCRGCGLGIIPSGSARRDIITVHNDHTGRRYLSIYRTSNSTSPLLPPFLLPSNGSSCISHSQISLLHRNISIILRVAGGSGRWECGVES